MTPCIVAVGTRTLWRGVPCKGDGSIDSSGPVLVDLAVRLGVAGAARRMVDEAPFGWDWVGGEKLTEPDDFLGPTLSEKTPSGILGNHFALYLFDPTANRLEILHLPEHRWLEPAIFGPDGTLTTRPSWYSGD